MNTLLRRLVWIIIIVPAIYLAIVWKQIPQTVPVHFDIKGNVDSYGSKNNLFLLVALTPIIYLIIANVYKIDPKKNAALNKERLQRIAFYIVLYLTAIWVMLIYQIAHNDVSNMMKFVFIAMGLLFALLGNNMYNIKPNYFAGLRLPWTLENEDNWRKTHQFAGRLWFFGGLGFAAMVFLLNNQWAIYMAAITLAILILIPVFYSYNLYKNQTKKDRA
jgi:uncharacterized membrane protein